MTFKIFQETPTFLSQHTGWKFQRLRNSYQISLIRLGSNLWFVFHSLPHSAVHWNRLPRAILSRRAPSWLNRPRWDLKPWSRTNRPHANPEVFYIMSEWSFMWYTTKLGILFHISWTYQPWKLALKILSNSWTKTLTTGVEDMQLSRPQGGPEKTGILQRLKSLQLYARSCETHLYAACLAHHCCLRNVN